MYFPLAFLGASSLAAASAIQYPLGGPSTGSQALIQSKPLVSSDALQRDISSEKLLERAKHLFKLAERGSEEYNHPTRVIGSKGKLKVLAPTAD